MNSDMPVGPTPFLKKLGSLRPLSEADSEAAIALCSDVRTFRRGQRLVAPGSSAATPALIVLEGWVAQQEVSFTGKRCITSLLLPGDSYGLWPEWPNGIASGLHALSRCQVAVVSRAFLQRPIYSSPSFQALSHLKSLADLAIARRWLVNKTSISAYEALGHLLAELHARSQLVDASIAETFELQASQEDIGAALGLTAVHVNRMLHKMRADGVIGGVRGQIVVHDVAELRRVCGFDPAYLHPAGHMPG